MSIYQDISWYFEELNTDLDMRFRGIFTENMSDRIIYWIMQGQVHDTDRLFEDPIKFVNFEFKMSGIVFAGRELKYVT